MRMAIPGGRHAERACYDTEPRRPARSGATGFASATRGTTRVDAAERHGKGWIGSRVWTVQSGNASLRLLMPPGLTRVPARCRYLRCFKPLRCSNPASVTLVPGRYNVSSRLSLARCSIPASLTSVFQRCNSCN